MNIFLFVVWLFIGVVHLTDKGTMVPKLAYGIVWVMLLLQLIQKL